MSQFHRVSCQRRDTSCINGLGQELRSAKHPILEVQWVKKLSQCLAVLERLTWHKSSKLHNNLKIIYVILGHFSFQISRNARDLEQN
jgi:hypothetical protein